MEYAKEDCEINSKLSGHYCLHWNRWYQWTEYLGKITFQLCEKFLVKPDSKKEKKKNICKIMLKIYACKTSNNNKQIDNIKLSVKTVILSAIYFTNPRPTHRYRRRENIWDLTHYEEAVRFIKLMARTWIKDTILTLPLSHTPGLIQSRQ